MDNLLSLTMQFQLIDESLTLHTKSLMFVCKPSYIKNNEKLAWSLILVDTTSLVNISMNTLRIKRAH